MDTIIHIGANNLMLHSCILRIVQILRPNNALLLPSYVYQIMFGSANIVIYI